MCKHTPVIIQCGTLCVALLSKSIDLPVYGTKVLPECQMDDEITTKILHTDSRNSIISIPASTRCEIWRTFLLISYFFDKGWQLRSMLSYDDISSLIWFINLHTCAGTYASN